MFDVDLTSVEELLARWKLEQERMQGELAQAVDVAARAGAADARAAAPRKTGALVDSIDGGVTSASPTVARGKIHVGVDYASFVSDGTEPHIIEAKRARVLAFEQDGAMRFARRVRHPGTARNPYLERSKAVAQQELDAQGRRIIAGIASRLGG